MFTFSVVVVDLTTDCILSFLLPAETDVLVPVFQDVVVVNFVVVLRFPNVVHRDLKAENVLLTTTEDVKLADFGLVREFVAMKTDTRPDDDSWLGSYSQYMDSVVGTRHWMAPEVFEGRYTEKPMCFPLVPFSLQPFKGILWI